MLFFTDFLVSLSSRQVAEWGGLGGGTVAGRALNPPKGTENT